MADNDNDIIKKLFSDIYNIQLRYLYVPLNDYLWESFIREMDELRDKYKVYGENIDRLCRDMILALTSYKERKGKTNGRKDGQQDHS